MSLSLVSPPRTQSAFTIAVTSGKGGVGKTSVAINLAVALSRLGYRIALFDADFALGNIDVRLGLAPDANIGDILTGDVTVDDITVEGPFGVDVIPAASGVQALAAPTGPQWGRITAAITAARRGRDFLILDTATGIADSVIDVVGQADYALIVTSYDPAALVDAYAVVKLLTAASRSRDIGVLVNSARDERQAELVFRQLSRASERFLDRTLRYDGYIVEDQAVRASALGHVPLADGVLGGPASQCFRRLAARLSSWRPLGPGPGPARPALPGLSAPHFSESPRCA